tara:strand:- start:71891 stop:72238 length:348 start_codon:yes stop_codon:yes gene_type:complete
MRLLGVFVLVVMIFLAPAAFARNGSNYQMYSYGSHGNSNYNAYSYSGNGSSNYKGYNARSYGRHGSAGRNYWRGNYSTNRYNDPTAYRIVYVNKPNPPMPSGNYGRAANRVRVSY